MTLFIDLANLAHAQNDQVTNDLNRLHGAAQQLRTELLNALGMPEGTYMHATNDVRQVITSDWANEDGERNKLTIDAIVIHDDGVVPVVYHVALPTNPVRTLDIDLALRLVGDQVQYAAYGRPGAPPATHTLTWHATPGQLVSEVVAKLREYLTHRIATGAPPTCCISD